MKRKTRSSLEGQDSDHNSTTPTRKKKKDEVASSDSSSASEEEQTEPTMKTRHSTAPAFNNSLNIIYDDHFLLSDYLYQNRAIGIKFKTLMKSLLHMEIIEKYFIFNHLHSIKNENISEDDCICLLTLANIPITDKEISSLTQYLKSKSKPPTPKYKYLDIEDEQVRYYWQLSFQTWVTFYNDMIYCYSRKERQFSDSATDTLDTMRLDSNFYVKVLLLIRKKLRYLPGKKTQRDQMSLNFTKVCELISDMDDNSIERLDGIHTLIEKIASCNFYFHFMLSEPDKRQQIDTLIDHVQNNYSNSITPSPQRFNMEIPITTKTAFSSIPVTILDINSAIVTFNRHIKPVAGHFVESIRGPSIKALTVVTYIPDNGINDNVINITPTITNGNGKEENGTTLATSTTCVTTTSISSTTPVSNKTSVTTSPPPVVTIAPATTPKQVTTKETSVTPKEVSKETSSVTTKKENVTPNEVKQSPSAENIVKKESLAKSSSTNDILSDTTTATNQSTDNKEATTNKDVIKPKTDLPPTNSTTTAGPNIPPPVTSNDKIITDFVKWWTKELGNFDTTKHQSLLSPERMMTFFNSSIKADFTPEKWGIISEAIAQGLIPRLKLEKTDNKYRIL